MFTTTTNGNTRMYQEEQNYGQRKAERRYVSSLTSNPLMDKIG